VRRLLNDAWAYLVDLARSLVRGWSEFFFTPADPTALGLIRLVVGLLLFWNLFVYGLDLRDFFGSEGWADPAIVQLAQSEQTPRAWSFWFYVPDAYLRPVWVACLVVAALFTLGLGSRVTAVLAWVILVSTSRRVPMALFGFDQILPSWVFYLAVTGASGQAVSLDRFLERLRQGRLAAKRRRTDGRWPMPPGAPTPTISANLALRLIQLHLVLIYGMAGLAKLQGPAWWNGTAIWGTLAASEFRVFDLTWLASYPRLLNLLTHASLALELGYPILIWRHRFRPLLIGAMVFLHVGVELTLGLGEFGIVMLAGNLAFVSGSWLRSLVTGREQPAGRLLYDGACPRCRASTALVTACDPDRVIEPVDLTAVSVTSIHPSLTREACMRAMHLVRADGRIRVGYDAMVTLAGWLPLFWPLYCLGILPPVAWIGRRVYNQMAASRPRDVPCTDEVCEASLPQGPVSTVTERRNSRR